VAEGVETEAQLTYLRERGCYGMQGWLLSKPLSADDFARFVRSRMAGPLMPMGSE
jgi:sensor c-di-GMP phosphodiesterase-like protein